MKKNGFTLAEVLVTLGIIGVVAALAMPALNSAVQKTKVGPSLRKFMYSIENANRLVMQDKDVDDLSVVVNGSITTYLQEINKNIAGGSYSTTAKSVKVNGSDKSNKFIYKTSAGEEFYVDASTTKTAPQPDTNYNGKMWDVYYDMNGFDTTSGKPNKYGKDQFVFFVDKNGTVIPKGSKAAAKAYCTSVSGTTVTGPEDEVISTSSNATIKNCADTTGENACESDYAAGAIANNGWKVGYKY